MQKIIAGKRYDPKRAVLVGRSPAGALYRKQTGEYFLLVGNDIYPLGLTEARTWAKENLSPEECAKSFSDGENGGRVVRSYAVQRKTAQHLQDFAALEKRTRGEIVDDAVELYRQAAHPDFYKQN